MGCVTKLLVTGNPLPYQENEHVNCTSDWNDRFDDQG